MPAPAPALARQDSVSAVDGKTWLPGTAVKPLNYGPIKVQVAVNFHYIKLAESQAQAFASRFGLHLAWEDPYYQLVDQPENKKDIIHYSTHPGVGRPSRNFPQKAESIRGVEIDTNGLPRWTPEIVFLNTEHRPTITREEYSADRETGIVTCYLEGTGNFAHDQEISRHTQTLKWCISSHHRTHTLKFVLHVSKPSKVCESPFSEWSFDDKPLKPDFSEVVVFEREYGNVMFTISAKRNLEHWCIRGLKKLASPLYAYDVWIPSAVGALFTLLWKCMLKKQVCGDPNALQATGDDQGSEVPLGLLPVVCPWL